MIESVNQFLWRNRQVIRDWVYDSLTLGDAYLVINPNGGLVNVPPDQVEIVTDELDWRRVLAYQVTTRLPHAVITDEYRLDGRTVKIKRTPSTQNGGNSTQAEILEYQNLIGRLPVVHLANDREANEVYGHPVYEGLLTLFAEYDEVLRKSLNGVKVMGHPVPVVEGLEDVPETLEMNVNDTERYLDSSGNWQERGVIDFARLNMLFLGRGAHFKFASPGTFAGDTGRLLEYLFLLMLQHAKIPEWVWGGAISSSKASVEAQRPAFTMMIQSRRARLEAALMEVVGVWWAMQELTSPPGPLSKNGEREDVPLKLVWPEMVAEEEAMTLRKVEFAYSHEIIDKNEARGLLGF